MNLQRTLLPIALSLITLALTLSSVQAKEPVVKYVPRPFSIPQTPIETLKSDRLLDYDPLQTLLRSGKWNEAATMTSTLMLKAGSKLEQGVLTEANTRYGRVTGVQTCALPISFADRPVSYNFSAHPKLRPS